MYLLFLKYCLVVFRAEKVWLENSTAATKLLTNKSFCHFNFNSKLRTSKIVLFSNFIDGLVDLVPYGIDKIPYSMEKVPYSVDQIINCSSEQFIILMKRSTLTNNQETI